MQFNRNNPYSGNDALLSSAAFSVLPPEILKNPLVSPQAEHSVPYFAFSSHSGVSPVRDSSGKTKPAISRASMNALIVYHADLNESLI